MHQRSKLSACAVVLLGGTAVSAVVIAGGQRQSAAQAQRSKEEVKVGVTPAQATAAIRTAVAARPGTITELDAERKQGRLVCEITVLGRDGRERNVNVDVRTNKVVSIERDPEP